MQERQGSDLTADHGVTRRRILTGAGVLGAGAVGAGLATIAASAGTTSGPVYQDWSPEVEVRLLGVSDPDPGGTAERWEPASPFVLDLGSTTDVVPPDDGERVAAGRYWRSGDEAGSLVVGWGRVRIGDNGGADGPELLLCPSLPVAPRYVDPNDPFYGDGGIGIGNARLIDRSDDAKTYLAELVLDPFYYEDNGALLFFSKSYFTGDRRPRSPATNRQPFVYDDFDILGWNFSYEARDAVA